MAGLKVSFIQRVVRRNKRIAMASERQKRERGMEQNGGMERNGGIGQKGGRRVDIGV